LNPTVRELLSRATLKDPDAPCPGFWCSREIRPPGLLAGRDVRQARSTRAPARAPRWSRAWLYSSASTRSATAKRRRAVQAWRARPCCGSRCSLAVPPDSAAPADPARLT
jgi:hypothetical protein